MLRKLWQLMDWSADPGMPWPWDHERPRGMDADAFHVRISEAIRSEKLLRAKRLMGRVDRGRSDCEHRYTNSDGDITRP